MRSPENIVATIEARMTSSRLPGKVLMEVADKSFLAHMIERLRRVPSLNGIVIATTKNDADDPIAELAADLDVGCFRGSEKDVLHRVLSAARAHKADLIVETTGDCPLIDPDLVELCIQAYLGTNVDYVSNVLERTYPVGMDTQVFSTDILADAAKRTDHPDDREHVSLYIYRHPEIYSLKNIPGPSELSWPNLRLTLDTPADFENLRFIFETLYPTNPCFDLADVLELVRCNTHLSSLNLDIRDKNG